MHLGLQTDATPLKLMDSVHLVDFSPPSILNLCLRNFFLRASFSLVTKPNRSALAFFFAFSSAGVTTPNLAARAALLSVSSFVTSAVVPFDPKAPNLSNLAFFFSSSVSLVTIPNLSARFFFFSASASNFASWSAADVPEDFIFLVGLASASSPTGKPKRFNLSACLSASLFVPNLAARSFSFSPSDFLVADLVSATAVAAGAAGAAGAFALGVLVAMAFFGAGVFLAVPFLGAGVFFAVAPFALPFAGVAAGVFASFVTEGSMPNSSSSNAA
mmetsp:Transcript_9486/g.12473  ORF Transcript_9486/g.12473 Transcript_9486/m.12473 type:complete len:273 (-) Transcript_9486:292-1110(-)